MLRRLLAAALVAALAVTAACSGSGGGNDSATGDVPAADAAGRKTSGGVPLGAAPEGIPGVEAFRVDSRNHTEEPLDYDHRPPTGGDHFPVPATCGFYDNTNRPPDELLVHDLEHGAVWFAYQPDLPTAERDGLRKLIAAQPKTVATPHKGLRTPLVLTAWGRQLGVDSLDDPRVMRFIDAYRNRDDAPEPTAACQGVGQPEVAAPTS